jgi:hypothetical protein
VATVYQVLEARSAELRTTAFPQLVKNNGTNIPISGYAFDASTEEAIFFDLEAISYGSGNVTIWIDWYADTASSGVVRWSAQLAAITPDTDSQDVETDALATAATVDDTHLGTTGQRLHRAIITVTSLDSLAAGDDVRLRIARAAAHANDTMSADAIATRITVSYSDT